MIYKPNPTYGKFQKMAVSSFNHTIRHDQNIV